MAAFRFALQASGAASPAAWRDLARKTEDLGYSTLYVPDHLDDQWAPMVALTVAGCAALTWLQIFVGFNPLFLTKIRAFSFSKTGTIAGIWGFSGAAGQKSAALVPAQTVGEGD